MLYPLYRVVYCTTMLGPVLCPLYCTVLSTLLAVLVSGLDQYITKLTRQVYWVYNNTNISMALQCILEVRTEEGEIFRGGRVLEEEECRMKGGVETGERT